jgi:hypothetical protein
MPDLNQIRRAEKDPEYWRNEALTWWRTYMKNLSLIHNLREQNRKLRLLLQDYQDDLEELREPGKTEWKDSYSDDDEKSSLK